METTDVNVTVGFPTVIELEGLSPKEFKEYYLENEAMIDEHVEKSGAVKFLGVRIDSTDDFQEIVDGISSKFLQYVDGNSPRTKITGNVYTSTEYDNTQRITMHNELSYSKKWPSKLFLSCLIPAETGGETLLADSRRILKEMNPDIVRQVEEKGITYIRNLHGGQGMGPSWQETFETEDKNQLEDYCKLNGVDFSWKEDGSIRLLQKSDGIIKHPKTGEPVWFNQIDQFHACHLGEELYEAMQMMYESPDDYPMHVRFSNGDEISEEIIKETMATIDSVTVAPKWNKNEFLIVDNVLSSHGRNPFTGDRRVILSMAE